MTPWFNRRNPGAMVVVYSTLPTESTRLELFSIQMILIQKTRKHNAKQLAVQVLFDISRKETLSISI